MIKVVIIDDERDARFLLRNILETKFASQVTVIGEADDVDTGLEAISTLQPDVVFLDIKMPQGTGFDLLSKIKKVNFEVVFVTAFDSYAIDAFKFSALGYLMKPIKLTELQKIIDRFSDQQLLKFNKVNADKRVKVLIENYGDEKKVLKLVLSNMEGFQVVNLEDIIRLEGEGTYTSFILENVRPITSSKNIGEYEELLNNHGFFRIHQSTIVNLRHVAGFQKADGGRVEMSDGVLLKLSRHRKADFMERFF